MNLHEQFRKDIKSIITNIDTIDTYTEDTKIEQEFKFICLYCENEYTETIHRTLMGYGCPICKKKPRKDVGKSPKVFRTRMKYIHPNLQINEDYRNSSKPISVTCKLDDYTWKIKPNDLLNGHGCPKCAGTAKKTTQSFKDELYKRNKDIEVIGEYINNSTGILCRCKIDSHIWKPTPNSLLNGKYCPKCANRNKTKSHETFKQEIEQINKNIELLSKYKGCNKDIKCKCLIDNYIWETKANLLLSGHGCPKCGRTAPLTDDEYKARVYEINKNVIILGNYVNSNTKIKVKCLIDGFIWDVKSYSLLKGSGCPKCKGLHRTHSEFLEAMKDINDNIEFMTEYVNTVTKIKCRCKKDGFIWYTRPAQLLQNVGCPKCAGMYKTTSEFKAQLKLITEYIEVIGEYTGYGKPIKCRCLIDGYEWYAKPEKLLYGRGCPNCNKSRGESMVYTWITSMSIDSLGQSRLIGLYGKDKSPLRYDYMCEVEGLKFAIEYHGVQHYKYNKFFYKDTSDMEYRHELDRKKKLFTIDNGVYFIEIPYLINNQQDVDYFMNFHLRRILMNCSELEVIPRVVIDMIIKAQDLGYKIDTLKALTSWIYSAEKVSEDLYSIRYKNSIFEDYDRTEELTLDEFIARYKIMDKN